MTSYEWLEAVFGSLLPASGALLAVVWAVSRCRRLRHEERVLEGEREREFREAARRQRGRPAVLDSRGAGVTPLPLPLPETARVMAGLVHGAWAPPASRAACGCLRRPALVLDERGLDIRQSKGVSFPDMSTMTRERDGTPAFPGPDRGDLDELSARLAGTIAAAGFREREREEAAAEFMSADPASCRHLIAQDVTLMDGVTVVARLCPACGAQVQLEEEREGP